MGFLGTFQGSSGRLAAQLGEALGQGLGEMTGSYFANSALNKVINDPNLKNAPVEEKLQALTTKLAPFGERGRKMFDKQLEIEQKGQDTLQQSLLSKGLRGELKPEEREKLTLENQLKLNERERSMQLGNKVRQSLLDHGVPQELADYYGEMIASTEKGTGQSSVINDALQAANRYGNLPQSDAFTSYGQKNQISKINPEFEFPAPDKIQGRNPKEIADIKNGFAQENLKISNENRSKRQALETSKFDYRRLLDLSDQIPTGWDKWNINPLTGEIILPAQATPAEKEFQKILVNQLKNAKDVFGARLTNFDVKTFLEGFPSLADNPEGRRKVLEHLQLANDVNLLKEKALSEVYKVYKPDEISPIQAQNIAEDMVEEQAMQMREDFFKRSSPNAPTTGEVEVTYQGKRYAVPEDQLDSWLKAGATR